MTGAGSGIGRAIALRMAADGHDVALLDLDEAAAASVAAEVNGAGRAIALAADVADRTSIDAAYARVRSELGPIGIVVTCAAIMEFCAFEDVSVERWERTLAINLTGTFHCLQAALPDMRAAGWGRIVTLSSYAGQTGTPRMSAYAASKAGVIALTKAVSQEVAALGITANTIPPFAIDTPALRAAEASGEVPVELVVQQIPARRVGAPKDIAALCSFLCSEEAAYVTGQVVSANGGMWS